jgi:hypothetical protein
MTGFFYLRFHREFHSFKSANGWFEISRGNKKFPCKTYVIHDVIFQHPVALVFNYMHVQLPSQANRTPKTRRQQQTTIKHPHQLEMPRDRHRMEVVTQWPASGGIATRY